MLGDAGSMVSAATRGEICKDTVRNKFGEQWFIKSTQMPPDINEIIRDIYNIRGIPDLCKFPDSWDGFFVNNKWANTYKYMAFTKYRHFCQFASIYPELDFVFIGDSGQGDLLTSILMQSHPQMKACLIKKVIESKELSKINLEKYDQLSEELARMSNNKIFMFDNYIDAAIALYSKEHCTKTKLKQIANDFACASHFWFSFLWSRSNTGRSGTLSPYVDEVGLHPYNMIHKKKGTMLHAVHPLLFLLHVPMDEI